MVNTDNCDGGLPPKNSGLFIISLFNKYNNKSAYKIHLLSSCNKHFTRIDKMFQSRVNIHLEKITTISIPVLLLRDDQQGPGTVFQVRVM